MKPFARVVTFGEDRGSWLVYVGEVEIDGNPFRGMSWNTKTEIINAAFESRLKEEIKNFRERSIKRIRDERVNEKETGQEADRAYNLALDHAINAINATPLFETEEKP